MNSRMLAVIAAALLVEVIVVNLLYWARVTIATDPERFLGFESALASDSIIFVAAPVLTALLAGWAFSRGQQPGMLVSYVGGGVLSALAFGVAMLVALNTWGS